MAGYVENVRTSSELGPRISGDVPCGSDYPPSCTATRHPHRRDTTDFTAMNSPVLCAGSHTTHNFMSRRRTYNTIPLTGTKKSDDLWWKNERQYRAEQYRKRVESYENRRRKRLGEVVNAPSEPVNFAVEAQRRQPDLDAAAGTTVGLLGTASLVNPAIAPVAVAAGLGYGAYKLGQSLSLW